MGMILNKDHVSMPFRVKILGVAHSHMHWVPDALFVLPLVLVLNFNLLQSLPLLPILFVPSTYAKLRHTFSMKLRLK